MIRFLLNWLLSALSLTMVSKFLPGVHIASFGSALVAAAVYGILQVLLYRILTLLAFIPMLLTFGLFAFIIQAFLLHVTTKLLDDFKIDGLATTLIAAVLLTVLNGIWGRIF